MTSPAAQAAALSRLLALFHSFEPALVRDVLGAVAAATASGGGGGGGSGGSDDGDGNGNGDLLALLAAAQLLATFEDEGARCLAFDAFGVERPAAVRAALEAGDLAAALGGGVGAAPASSESDDQLEEVYGGNGGGAGGAKQRRRVRGARAALAAAAAGPSPAVGFHFQRPALDADGFVASSASVSDGDEAEAEAGEAGAGLAGADATDPAAELAAASAEAQRLRARRADLLARAAAMATRRDGGAVGLYRMAAGEYASMARAALAEAERLEERASRAQFRVKNGGAAFAVPASAIGGGGCGGNGGGGGGRAALKKSGAVSAAAASGSSGGSFEVDLHGQTVAQAVALLRDFVLPACGAEGARELTVVTGRGLHSGAVGPRLREQVLAWLASLARSREALGGCVVLGVEVAAEKGGGMLRARLAPA